MNNYNDIIKGVRKNEMKAQMAFYDLFFRPVFQSAYSIIGNHNEAEEIVHDTLLKVFTKTELLHEEPKAMTRLLKRMAINHAIDMLRKRKDFIHSMEEEEPIDMEDEIEEGNDGYDLSIVDIKNGISKLSMAYRSIITLRLFEEMGFAEISEQLKINASTVRVQYSRGILKLRTLLKQQIYSYE
jgi:RNA polymerase sigma-70 factor (ECF subfamily)